MVAALYRIMWTVALMTPVVLGRKDCRRELMDTDRKTVLLCGPVAAAVFALFLFGEVPPADSGGRGDNRGRSPLFPGRKERI